MGNADTSSILSRALHQHPLLLDLVRGLVRWITRTSVTVFAVVMRDPGHAEHLRDGVQDAVLFLLTLQRSEFLCHLSVEDPVKELGGGKIVHG